MTSTKTALIQWPVFHTPEQYESSILNMCSVIKSIPGVKSIYQVGGISDYGISDIDILVIFENEIITPVNPLNSEERPANRYLFSHRLFGTTENRINDLENFTCFRKYKKLYGQEYTFNLTLPETELKILEKQIALEYMVKAFISLHIAITFSQVKVRNLLLHVKALKLDLELLGIIRGSFYEQVTEFISMRKDWFKKTPDASQLETKILQLYQNFRTLLEELMHHYPFYVPGSGKLKISRNIELICHHQFRTPEFGIPSLIKSIIPEKRREAVLNRIFRFCFRFPIISHNIPDVVQQRYNYIYSGVEFNRTYLPFFLCTAYGLDIFSRKS